MNKYYIRENLLEMNSYNNVDNINWEKDYEKFFQEYAPCFVLSTGRCGTALLTKILKLHKKISVYHSDYLIPNPLLKFYQNKAYKEEDQGILSNILEASRAELIYRSYRTGQNYIETNPRITFFAHAAIELFPNAKFIHLVRDPKSFVISGLRRGWYLKNNMETIGLIKGKERDWDDKNSIEKIGWLWNETQKYIEEFKTKYPSNTLTVKSEDLFERIEESKKIFEFINLTSPKNRKLQKITSKPVNKQLTGSYIKYEDWSESERESLRKEASLYLKYNYIL